jgi:hypothetical protein
MHIPKPAYKLTYKFKRKLFKISTILNLFFTELPW